MSYFVVTNEQGPAWVAGRSMREQALWAEHAAFVNSCVAAGFVIAAGPLGNGPLHRALLIVSAQDESVARKEFAADPWIQDGILRIVTIEPWTLLASDDRLDRVLEQLTRTQAPT
jgi:uncharacterized protein YciI